MAILHISAASSNRVPMSPIDFAVRSLREALNELAYNPTVSREICQSAYRTHSLVEAIGLGAVDDEDINTLTEALANGFPPVHGSHPSWSDPATWSADLPPTVEEARQYARLIGAYDPADAPLIAPADLEPADDSPAWDEYALWSATLDPAGPIPDVESAELAEVGILRR